MLFIHGNCGYASAKAYLVDRLLKAGTSVLCYDYSGYGHSKGKPSLRGLSEDGHGAQIMAMTDCLLQPPAKKRSRNFSRL